MKRKYASENWDENKDISDDEDRLVPPASPMTITTLPSTDKKVIHVSAFKNLILSVRENPPERETLIKVFAHHRECHALELDYIDYHNPDEDYIDFKIFNSPENKPLNKQINFIFDFLILDINHIINMINFCQQFVVKVIYLRIEFFKLNDGKPDKNIRALVSLLNILYDYNPGMRFTFSFENIDRIPVRERREIIDYINNFSDANMDFRDIPFTYALTACDERSVTVFAECFSQSRLSMRSIKFCFWTGSNDVSMDTLMILQKLLESKPMLECFYMMPDMNDVFGEINIVEISTLAESLNNCLALKELALCACHVKDSDIEKFKPVFSRVEKLFLRNNTIGDKGAIRLGQILKNNTRIKEIDLSENHDPPDEHGSISYGRRYDNNVYKIFSTLLMSNTRLTTCDLVRGPKGRYETYDMYIQARCSENAEEYSTESIAEYRQLNAYLKELPNFLPVHIIPLITQYCMKEKRDLVSEFDQSVQKLQLTEEECSRINERLRRDRLHQLRSCLGYYKLEQTLRDHPGLFVESVRKSPKLRSNVFSILKRKKDVESAVNFWKTSEGSKKSERTDITFDVSDSSKRHKSFDNTNH